MGAVFRSQTVIGLRVFSPRLTIPREAEDQLIDHGAQGGRTDAVGGFG